MSMSVTLKSLSKTDDGRRAKRVYTDQTAPNAKQENREAEAEGSKELEQFVYFTRSRVVEHRHYDIGTELQSTCSVPSVETTGILLRMMNT